MESEINFQFFEKWKRTYTKIEIQLVSRYDYDEFIEKFLDKEVESKRNKLISRIVKKCGNITDARNLRIGINGEINGHITGEIKTAKIETVYAGGYNIQSLHYRVLIK